MEVVHPRRMDTTEIPMDRAGTGRQHSPIPPPDEKKKRKQNQKQPDITTLSTIQTPQHSTVQGGKGAHRSGLFFYAYLEKQIRVLWCSALPKWCKL